MNTPRRTIRMDDELWTEAQAAAAEEGVDVSTYVREAVRARLRAAAAVVVAVLAVLGLSACGGADEPAAASQPSATTPAVDEPSAPARGRHKDCETSAAVDALWQGLPTSDAPVEVRLEAYRALLAVIPADADACTDVDRSQFQLYRDSLTINVSDLEHPTD